ncbi:MAG TPA: ATP-binding protein [Acidimicrobiales bacterium]|nr:ATP-binding protein [Acidimicrobiales bacterium]
MTAAPAVGVAMVDLLPDAVLQVDAALRIVSANAAAERLTGYGAAVLVGSYAGALLDVRTSDGTPVWRGRFDRGAWLPGVRAFREDGVRIRRCDGSHVVADVAGSYLRDGAGRPLGAVVVARPARKRPEGEVSGIEIVSTVSHELRSPLTSVKGYTSLLLNRWERLDDDQKKMMLEQVHHDADRVTRLITELLDISRLESGRLHLQRHAVDLTALAGSVVDKVRLEYPALEAALTFPSSFPAAWADSDKIEQVLVNLVENACKYASPTGITIQGSASRSDVTVTVSDRGPGIPGGDLGQVFTKFFRRGEGRPTGSGLGLWISRGLIEAHGGKLVAASTPGEGSSFSFTLPRADIQPIFTA